MDVLTYLIDISTEECEDLISAATVGRLGVIVDGRPEIFPVNHVYDRGNGCVVFPTNASTKFRAVLLELADSGLRGGRRRSERLESVERRGGRPGRRAHRRRRDQAFGPTTSGAVGRRTIDSLAPDRAFEDDRPADQRQGAVAPGLSTGSSRTGTVERLRTSGPPRHGRRRRRVTSSAPRDLPPRLGIPGPPDRPPDRCGTRCARHWAHSERGTRRPTTGDREGAGPGSGASSRP